MTDLIVHASEEVAGNALILEEDRVRTNLYDLDSGTMSYWSLNPDALVEGMDDPTYPGLEIEELDRRRNGDVWEFTAAVAGVKGVKAPRQVKDGYRKTEPIGDFDTFEETWLTTNENHFAKGQRVGNYVCYNVSGTQRVTGKNWWKVTGQFAGLKAIRQPTRVITVNGQVVTSDRLRVALEGGWNDYRKGQASFPRVVITDTQHTTLPPATGASPGNRVPLNAPPIRNITFSGADLRAVWPKGWTFTPGGRQPFGIDINLWIVENTYEWNLANLPA